jgi:hypothetical protein
MLVPFLGVMFFSFTLALSFLSALALATLFFLILGIKDLALVDRATAYESLLFLLIFLAAITTYEQGGSWLAWRGWLPCVEISVLLFFLIRRLPWQDLPRDKQNTLSALVFSFLALEFSLVLLFLPLDFLYQASILFLFCVFLCYCLTRFRQGEASFRIFMYYFSAFVLASGFILALNSWRI